MFRIQFTTLADSELDLKLTNLEYSKKELERRVHSSKENIERDQLLLVRL